jgi:hypothetical protein
MTEVVARRPNPKTRTVTQLLWPDKDREVWFSFGRKPRKSLSLRSTPIAKLLDCRRPELPHLLVTLDPELCIQQRHLAMLACSAAQSGLCS